MKGIVLAGGLGSRLSPLTDGVSKQLLPVYDKPMIYYPISVLMMSGIRDILIITSPEDQNNYIRCLGNGERFGVKLTYKIQEKPEGLAQAFHIGERFIENEKVCLILGDNIFWGDSLQEKLIKAKENINGATVFGYSVNNPVDFGVVEFDSSHKVVSIEEKPKNPKSNFAVTGLYFYDNKVCNLSKKIKPSKRNELEITSLNNLYLRDKRINAELLGRGYAWFDCGTTESLLSASYFIEGIQKRQNFIVACLEEIAYHNNWLSDHVIQQYKNIKPKNAYQSYVKKLFYKEI